MNLNELLEKNSMWNSDGQYLILKYKGRDYFEILTKINSVSWLAQNSNHHPDINFGYNTLEIRLTTHDKGGITQKDIDLANEISKHVF